MTKTTFYQVDALSSVGVIIEKIVEVDEPGCTEKLEAYMQELLNASRGFVTWIRATELR